VIRGSRLKVRNVRNVLLFLSPWIIGFTLFVVYPMLSSLRYSFTRYGGMLPPQWIGLDNYKMLFFEDDLFWTALVNTLYFASFSIILGTLMSITLALLLNVKIRGVALYRTIFYLPSIVPVVASSVVWLWIFNPSHGILNNLFRLFRLPHISWLASPTWSKPALILMGLWGVGGAIIIYLAGLQGIPQQLYEAADIDGAQWWHKIIFITIPMLSPVILFNVIMGLIGSFQYFTQAYIMTGGGPINSTLFYSLYLYRNAFQYFRMGYACALAWLLFFLILSCTLLILRSSARWVYYGGK
jgi:multiple sugar transport system permease protein